MYCQKFHCILTFAVSYLYLLIENLTQNVYISEFSDVDNEFLVKNVRN